MSREKMKWSEKTFPFSELIEILDYYLDLDCWIIPVDEWDDWQCVRKYRRASWPLDYDHMYGKRENRLKFNIESFKKILKEKKTFCGTRNGLSDFFVPILKNGEVIGFLELGDFLKKVPTREMLLKQWKDLTGYEASDSNVDFLRYVRVLLETPVLEGSAYRGLQEILELYAEILAGKGDPETVCDRARELKVKVFAKHFHHLWWLEKVIKTNWVYPPTWFIGGLRRWEREELGMGRIPTTVIAVMIDENVTASKDDLDMILQNYHFQRELLKFSKTLPNIAANPLEDYGMLFFTSQELGRNDVQAKLEIIDRINHISKFAGKNFRVKILAGVSRCSNPGENISKVYREAVTALGFCRPLGRSVLFYEDIRANPTIPEPPDFYELSKGLIDLCVKGQAAELDLARNRYVEQLLSRSGGRPEILRLHFLYLLGQIVDELKKRMPALTDDLQSLFETLERQAQEAGTIAGLIEVLREALKRFLALTLKPLTSSKAFRLEATRKYIDENFSQDLKLRDVARDNGFSVSVFGLGFKKVTGMGFSPYLRKVRLEKAKKLLTSTRLSIAQISLECGFNNLQYFFVVFKRTTRKTPQEFRDSVEWEKNSMFNLKDQKTQALFSGKRTHVESKD
jgi:AraC-like DNA-binding protein